MKFFIAAFLLFLALLIEGETQKISDSFNPIIKETPQSLNIVQHNDDNYLIFGDINYYGNEASGSLIKVDPSGKILSDFQRVHTDQSIQTVVVLPNGKILIHGTFRYLNGQRTGPIARLNADGSVDQSFHTDHNLKIRGIVVQSTGKIITINEVDGSYQELGRLHEDGLPDNLFTDNVIGYKLRALLGENDKIYVSDNTSIYRLMPDGAVDNTYAFMGNASNVILQFVQQDDGKLIALFQEITYSPNFTTRHTLRRFGVDGSIDDSFAAGFANQNIVGCVIRSDGKIAITGQFTTFDSHPGNAMELNADGSFSRSILKTDSNGIYSIFEDRQQNIFVTGGFKRANNNEGFRFIVKMKPDYQLDLSFRVPIYRTAGFWLSNPLASQADGKLLIGGAFFFSGVADDSSKVVRLFPDGTVDHSFQPAIKKTDDGTPNSARVNAIAVQSDGKIILGGNGIFDGQSSSIGRLLPDGQFDNTFQTGVGVYFTTYPGVVNSILIKDSKIYLFGLFDKFNGIPCQSLVILNESGSMIGPEKNDIPPNSFFSDVGIQSNGKIILMGTFNVGPSDSRNFLRLNSDGSIDNSFTLKTINGNPIDFEIDDNDNIILTGSYLDFDTKKILKRYKPDGEIDATFTLGNSFKSITYLGGYSVKAMKNDLLAVGGSFSSYNDISSPSIAIIDKDDSLIPIGNSFDSTSNVVKGIYANNILYMVGRLSKKGEKFYSGAKVVFPVEQIASNYQVKAISDSSMQLSWDGPFQGADRIVVEKSSPNESDFIVAATIAPNLNTYELRHLKEVSPYHIRIKGANDFYSSSYLSGNDTTYITPQIAFPATSVTPHSFLANWQYIPGTDSCMLQVSENNFAAFLEGYESVIVKSESLSVDDLEEGKQYQYRVKRFKNNKSSAFSEVIAVNVITAIEEEGSMQINVYPNPVTDHLLVELPSDMSQAEVVIHSMTGNIIEEYIIQRDGPAVINVQNFPAGIFIMSVSSQGKTKKFKLVRELR